MNDPIDDQELQRLLDATLPSEERALLLQHADKNPENWRIIALAFIEEQILRNELGEMFAEADGSATGSTPLTSHPDAPTGHKQIQWPIKLAQAAVLLLMLGGAHWMGRRAVEQPTGSESSGSYALVFTPDTAEPSEIPDPVVTALGEELDAMQRNFSPLFDQEAQATFHEHGYQVAEEPVIYVVAGQQGEQYLVPHRNITLATYHTD